jgi:TonB family protein
VLCTLLVGSVPPASTNQETVPGAMLTSANSTLSTLESAEYVENLADLQEKLKTAFHLDQLDIIGSYADWMAPGRQMVLEGGGTGLKLVVTPGVTKDYAETEVVVHRGDGTSYSTKRERAESTEYDLVLTSRGKLLLKKTWTVVPGTRTVLARQAEANGPVYFIILTLPQPGVSMRTTWGVEMQGAGPTSPGSGTVGRVTMGGVAVGRSGGRGTGSGTGVGAGVPAGVTGGTGSGRASGTGGASGSGAGVELRSPKRIYSVQPTLPAGARAAGLKGPVILSGTIASDGTVQNIQVLKSVEGLNDVAIAAFRQWRYEPPPLDENGKPVPIQVTVAFPFADEPQDDKYMTARE